MLYNIRKNLLRANSSVPEIRVIKEPVLVVSDVQDIERQQNFELEVETD